MSERLADKACPPSPEDIARHLGPEALERLERLEAWLTGRYAIARALAFPFGAAYGWGYKYSHRQAHLCHVFFERRALIVTLQIGDARVAALESTLVSLQSATQRLWADRYPCGERGGWVHLRVQSDADLADAMVLIDARKPGITRRSGAAQ
jgi:hypothetical protein